ncbi:unnamed protein product, partial [Polarella glacialis]
MASGTARQAGRTNQQRTQGRVWQEQGQPSQEQEYTPAEWWLWNQQQFLLGQHQQTFNNGASDPSGTQQFGGSCGSCSVPIDSNFPPLGGAGAATFLPATDSYYAPVPASLQGSWAEGCQSSPMYPVPGPLPVGNVAGNGNGQWHNSGALHQETNAVPLMAPDSVALQSHGRSDHDQDWRGSALTSGGGTTGRLWGSKRNGGSGQNPSADSGNRGSRGDPEDAPSAKAAPGEKAPGSTATADAVPRIKDGPRWGRNKDTGGSRIGICDPDRSSPTAVVKAGAAQKEVVVAARASAHSESQLTAANQGAAK